MLMTGRMNGLIILSKLLLIVSHLNSVLLLGDGEFKSPDGCNISLNCDYRASWSVNQTGDFVRFTIVAKQASNTWTAIGFAPQQTMEKTDVAYGFMNSAGQGVVNDGWIGAHYSTPTRDAIQNFFNTSLTYANGYLTMAFSRNRSSTDLSDYNFTNADCNYFFFPVGGGSVVSDNIQKHSTTPKISQDKICINTGSSNSTPSTPSGSPSSTSPSSTSSASSTTGSVTSVAAILLTFLLGDAVLTMLGGLVAEMNLRQRGSLEKKSYAMISDKSMKQETSVDADFYETYETMNAGGVTN